MYLCQAVTSQYLRKWHYARSVCFVEGSVSSVSVPLLILNTISRDSFSAIASGSYTVGEPELREV